MRAPVPTFGLARHSERSTRWGAAAVALLGLLLVWWMPLPAYAAPERGAPAATFIGLR